MNAWPALEYGAWKDTYETLHRWLQIVGKLRLSKSDIMNHSWHSAMYVTSTGLTTSPIPVDGQTVSVEFDFSEHILRISTSEGEKTALPLMSEPVAKFYCRFTNALKFLGVHAEFDTHPNELPDALPFPNDNIHRTYDPKYVKNLWHILVKSDVALKKFRSEFAGKASPVHFFWGSFDLATTRFSGRRAPEHPGGVPHLPDSVAKEAYSHEVSSCGFWPGNEVYPHAAFYSYAYPEPKGFKDFPMLPRGAFYHKELHEFILPYENVRTAANPEMLLMIFFRCTFEVAAELGKWDREAFEPSPYLRNMRRYAVPDRERRT